MERVEENRLNARLVERYIPYRNKFNKFNNTGARMLDSIFHMTFMINLKAHFWCALTSAGPWGWC